MQRRTGGGDSSGHEGGRGLARENSTTRNGSRNRLNSGGSQGPAQVPQQGLGGNEAGRQRVDSTRQGVLPTKEDHRARFHEGYRKVAEQYDKQFLKKHDEDLNTTLIFAGLFSAVTSAFIIQVDPQLQPDPNDQTVSLLRVLIYKIDNTTFGSDVPSLPKWDGPPPRMVQVQAILFASLAISLFSAFLAMLGKQWLNRYDSADERGSAIGRNHNRQQKLGGIVSWYFDHVMEALPLMLQIALLLVGGALSRYLWEVNKTVASVLIAFTSFGAFFYFFIVIAGTAFENCPYQTPGAHILRYIIHRYLPVFRSALPAIMNVVPTKCSEIVRNSGCYSLFDGWWSLMKKPWYSPSNIANTLIYSLLGPPIAFLIDGYRLCRAILRLLVAFGRVVYRWFATTFSPRPVHSPERRKAVSDLRCISWVLQTSLDRAVHLYTFKLLVSMPELSHLDPTLVVDCFRVFIGCINVSNGKVAIVQGLEDLATVSARGLFRTFHHLVITNPTSSILAYLHRRYHKAFPTEVSFEGLPFHPTMTMVRALVNRFGNPRYGWWNDHRLSGQGHLPFSRRVVEAARVKYQQMQLKKVPRWMLRSALHFLSLDTVLPASLVADYLTIIAIDMSCEVPLDITSLDESERVERVLNLITTKLTSLHDVRLSIKLTSDSDAFYKRKSITALVPYAIILGRSGDRRMVDAILNIANASDSGKFVWHRVNPYLTTLFDGSIPPTLNRVVTLMSPHVPWGDKLHDEHTVARWAEAALATEYSEEIGRSVVDALLQIASIDSLRPHIPIDLWAWLKNVRFLPPVCQGRVAGRAEAVVRHVRDLDDIEILKSYLFLIWSEWNFLYTSGFNEMRDSIRVDFAGIELKHHREHLVGRLDHVLKQLDRGWGYIEQHKPGINEYQLHRAKTDYRTLREALLEVEKEATPP